MKMQKCPNNHFYNTLKFASCPFCNQQDQKTQPPVFTEPEPKAGTPPKDMDGYGYSIFIDPIETNQHLQELEMEFHKPSSVSPLQMPSSEPIPTPPVTSPPKSALANEIKGRTIYIEPPQAEPIYPTTPIPSPAMPAVQPAAPSILPASSIALPAPNPPHPEPVPTDGKTKMLYGNVEPVVGWLICLKGAYVGESFPLKTGQNLIGRSIQMDVPLLDEETVSRDTHAYIIFEPLKAEFFVSDGQGKSLTYLNQHILMQPAKLKAYDILRFGECEYIFMPLCNEQFSWETYLGK